MKKLYLFILFINATASMYAQLDSIQHLTEVMLIDAKLEDYSEGFELIQLSDTLIARNSVYLREVLNFNTTIYFKKMFMQLILHPLLEEQMPHKQLLFGTEFLSTQILTVKPILTRFPQVLLIL